MPFITAGTWVMIAISIATSLTTYAYSRAQMKAAASKLKKSRQTGMDYLGNFRDTQVPIPVVYGWHEVGGNQFFISNCYSSGYFLGTLWSTHWLLVLQGLSEGPICEISKVYCDGVDVEGGSFVDGDGPHYFLSRMLGGEFQEPDEYFRTVRKDIIQQEGYRNTAYIVLNMYFKAEMFPNGYPNITALIKGRGVSDPRIVGGDGMQWQLREHEDTGGWGTATWAIGGGSMVMGIAAPGGLGHAYMFRVFPRAWLHHKYIQIKWRQLQWDEGSPPAARVCGHVEIMDGSYSRSSMTDFPPGGYRISKGAGLVQTLFTMISSADDSGWITEDRTRIEIEAAEEDNVTLFIRLNDGWVDRGVSLPIDYVKITDTSGNLLVEEDFNDVGDTVTMEVSGGHNDYGRACVDSGFPESEGGCAGGQNGALCMLDYMTNTRYGGGIPIEFFDLTSVGDAATWYDAKGWKFNAAIYEQDTLKDTLDKMIAATRIVPIFSGGLFKFKVLDVAAAVMHLGPEDIMERGFAFELPSAQNIPTSVRVKFADELNRYVLSDTIYHVPAFITAENEVREKLVDLLGVTDLETARKMAKYQALRSYYGTPYQFVASSKAFPLEPCDPITVTHPVPGWTAQKCIVESVEYLPGGNVGLNVLLNPDEIYDEAVDIEPPTGPFDPLPPDPTDPPPLVEDVAITGEDVNLGSAYQLKIKMTFSPPSGYPFLSFCEAWISENGTDYFTLGVKSGGFDYFPAEYGKTYYFKITGTSIYGISNELTDVTAYTFRRDAPVSIPNDVIGFNASGTMDAISLSWDAVTNVPGVSYEIRLGVDWEQSILVATTSETSLLLPYFPKGAWELQIKALDAWGRHSTNAGSCTFTSYLPADYILEGTWTDDYSAGVHNDTELFNDGVLGDVLRVDHTAAMQGDYTTPVQDLGAIATLRHWVDADFVQIPEGGDWEDRWGAADTWADIMGAGETWESLFSDFHAGEVQIDLLYSTDDITYYRAENVHLRSVEVNARYFQVQIFLVDRDAGSMLYIIDPITIHVYEHNVPGSGGTPLAGQSIVNTFDSVAGETIDAGEVVGLFRNGIRLGFGPAAGSALTTLNAAAMGSYISGAGLSDALAVCAYVKGDTYLYARATTIDSVWAPTVGAEATIYNAAAVTLVRVFKLDATTFLVTWIGAGSALFGSVCTIAGTTITVGATRTLHAASTGSYDCAIASATRFYVCYRDQGISNFLYANKADIAGDAITMGTEQARSATAADWISCAYLGAELDGYDRWVCCWQKSSTLVFQEMRDTATNVAGGNDTTLDGTNSPSPTRMGQWAKLSKQTAAVGWGYGAASTGSGMVSFPLYYGPDGWGSYYTQAKALWTGGDIKPLAWSDEDLLLITQNNNDTSLNWQLMRGYPGRHGAHWITPLVAIDTVIAWDASWMGGPENRCFALFYKDAADDFPKVIFLDFGIPMGLAEDANTGGTPIDIVQFGKIIDVTAALTKYAEYYIQPDGTLTTEPNGYPIGRALETDELLITKMYPPRQTY